MNERDRYPIIFAWHQLEIIGENILNLETGALEDLIEGKRGRKRCIKSPKIPNNIE